MGSLYRDRLESFIWMESLGVIPWGAPEVASPGFSPVGVP
jgi:hypothetical protein